MQRHVDVVMMWMVMTTMMQLRQQCVDDGGVDVEHAVPDDYHGES